MCNIVGTCSVAGLHARELSFSQHSGCPTTLKGSVRFAFRPEDHPALASLRPGEPQSIVLRSSPIRLKATGCPH